MGEVDRDIMKPEMMKSYIWLRTPDGSIQQVEQEIATYCPFICREIHSSIGTSKTYPISLPSRVSPAMLSLILDYCRFHQVPGHSNKERKSFDEKFIKMDTKRLCELTSAADSLQLWPLVDLTSRSLARMIEGKSAEEIREIFHLPDDLTEEEKLEPIRNDIDDPMIRLLNVFYARKRKELKDRDRLKNVEIEVDRVDERSVEDLLSFINGQDEDSKGTRNSKNKKKNRKRKDSQKKTLPNISHNTSSYNNGVNTSKQSNGLGSQGHDAATCDHFHSNLEKSEKLQMLEDGFVPDDDFDNDDLDDYIDPAMKEEVDREVEAFARRLQLQEFLSLGQERQRVPAAMKGNGSLSRYARLDHQK